MGNRKFSRSRSGTVAIFVFLGLAGLFMILPLIYSILQSLKPMEELFAFPPKFFVTNPTLGNYKMLSQLTNNLWVPFGRYLLNSILVTVVGTFFHVIIASMAAFALEKSPFPGSKIMYEMVVTAILFAGPVTTLPRYFIMAKTGMIDTYWAMILPAIQAPLGLFLMKQFMCVMPDSLMESANLDGAGIICIFWRIAMPLVKPAWLTLIIFSFMNLWNGTDFGTGTNIIYSENLKCLPTVLREISASGIARAGVGSAVTVLIMIPPIITFLITQSNILETMAYSGIKE